ncbi:hypothetical protein FCV25MIE_01950, partial [Fagus crenata]
RRKTGSVTFEGAFPKRNGVARTTAPEMPTPPQAGGQHNVVMQETLEEAVAKIPEDSINHESSTKTALITPINHGVMMDEDHATDPLVKNISETTNIEDVDINTSLNGMVTDSGDVIEVTKKTMTPILKVASDEVATNSKIS